MYQLSWLLVLLLLGVANTLKHVEQREIKTSDGQIFDCFYTINYNAKGRSYLIGVEKSLD